MLHVLQLLSISGFPLPAAMGHLIGYIEVVVFEQRTHRENSCNLWVRQEGKCFESCFFFPSFFVFRNRHGVYFGQEAVTHSGFKWQKDARKVNLLTLLELKQPLGSDLPGLLSLKTYPSV